ncbi:F0F1 ATP synthase subunit epsilon [Actinomycetaceae bacterium L2_0104]
MIVEIVQPRGLVWTGEATQVRLPAFDGEMGILPGHTPILSILQPGHLYISQEGRQDIQYEVTEGFVTVDEDHIYVVVDSAVRSDSESAGL